MSAIAAFDACLACGLERGEVTRASCTYRSDRLGFTLTLECTLTAERSRAIAESFLDRRPPVRELTISTPHGGWVWEEGTLRAVGGRTETGVRFDVLLDAPISESLRSDFREHCFAAYRVAFGEDEIAFTESLDPILRRPAMYIGPELDSHQLVESALLHVALGWVDGSARSVDVVLSESGQVTITDDGVPFSFKSRDTLTWVETALTQLCTGTPDARSERDIARRADFWRIGLVAVSALSTEFIVEASEGGRVLRQRFVRGRPGAPEPTVGWGSDGTRITFTPDLNVLDIALDPNRVRIQIEHLTRVSPGHVISLNGTAVQSRSLLELAAPLRQEAWLGAMFEHCVTLPGVRFRCALGLSEHGNGKIDSYVNLSRVDEQRVEWAVRDHVDALLAAVVDAVRLPTGISAAHESDLSGVVTLEAPALPIEQHELTSRQRLPADATDAIRRALFEPLSVFLDGIPGSREALVERWRE